jgi:hypothetical protein
VPPLVTACFYYWHCELLSIEAHESWKLLLLLSYSMIGLFATYSDLERKKERKTYTKPRFKKENHSDPKV